MRKYLLTMFLSCITLLVHAQMSDTQVAQYIQQEMRAGTTQSQIAVSLMERGVKMEQIQRVREQYEKGGANGKSESKEKEPKAEDADRARKNNGSFRADANGKALYTQMVNPQSDEDMAKRQKVQITDSVTNTIRGKVVFGRDIFNKPALSFEPNMNIVTPAHYVIGAGDQVIVDVYGASQRTDALTVSPDGAITIAGYGPVQIAGLTVSAAEAKVKRLYGERYSSSQIRLTVGQTRTIMVNIMGEVVAPGTYTLSAFATVFHALYMAGGVNSIGTLRNVKVFRGGRQITTVDIYDYILNGKLTGNVRLADNDVIMVGPYDCIVDITGFVKRPMAYEMRRNESIATLMKYAGGFMANANKKSVRVNRSAGERYSVYVVNEFDMAGFKVADGDSVTIDENLQRYENMVEVKGAVFRPGQYSLDDRVHSVKSLIEASDGLLEDAFTVHAVLHRMNADRTRRVISVDVQRIMDGSLADIPLENEDILFIPTRQERINERTITIHGEVQFPGTYEYADNETVEDFIMQAGGLTDAASTAKVDVARRIVQPGASTTSKEIAETFTFTIEDGFVVDGRKDFVLKPYDEVFVRKSPAFSPQRNITVQGEVLFEGDYTLTTKNQRLSDVIRMAGGVTEQAYVRGARIERPLNEDEKFRLEHLLKMAQVQGGSGLDASKMGQDTVYYVGIELDKALANPGSDYDVVLREGDRLVVPEYSGTVKINGNVMHPNTVAYMQGKSYKWYINKAGGYGNGAKRSKAYILYQNGLVSKASKGKVEPGCEIIVPNKTRSANQNIAMIASLGTSLATMVTMIATVTNLIKSF